MLVKRIKEYRRVTGGGEGVTLEKEGWLKVKNIGIMWEGYREGGGITMDEKEGWVAAGKEDSRHHQREYQTPREITILPEILPDYQRDGLIAPD